MSDAARAKTRTCSNCTVRGFSSVVTLCEEHAFAAEQTAALRTKLLEIRHRCCGPSPAEGVKEWGACVRQCQGIDLALLAESERQRKHDEAAYDPSEAFNPFAESIATDHEAQDAIADAAMEQEGEPEGQREMEEWRALRTFYQGVQNLRDQVNVDWRGELYRLATAVERSRQR